MILILCTTNTLQLLPCAPVLRLLFIYSMNKNILFTKILCPMILLELAKDRHHSIYVLRHLYIFSIERGCNIIVLCKITAEVSQILVSCETPMQWA